MAKRFVLVLVVITAGPAGVMLCNACGIRYARGHSPKAAKPVKRAGGAKHQPKARVHAHHDESEADMEIDAPEILPLKHINASDFLIEDIQEEEGKADGDKDDTYNGKPRWWWCVHY